jgi:hypothetical protein
MLHPKPFYRTALWLAAVTALTLLLNAVHPETDPHRRDRLERGQDIATALALTFFVTAQSLDYARKEQQQNATPRFGLAQEHCIRQALKETANHPKRRRTWPRIDPYIPLTLLALASVAAAFAFLITHGG